MPTGPLWEFRPICLTASSSAPAMRDRKSTRLNSSHSQISYAVFCLKKKKMHDDRLELRGEVVWVEPAIISGIAPGGDEHCLSRGFGRRASGCGECLHGHLVSGVANV